MMCKFYWTSWTGSLYRWSKLLPIDHVTVMATAQASYGDKCIFTQQYYILYNMYNEHSNNLKELLSAVKDSTNQLLWELCS